MNVIEKLSNLAETISKTYSINAIPQIKDSNGTTEYLINVDAWSEELWPWEVFGFDIRYDVVFKFNPGKETPAVSIVLRDNEALERLFSCVSTRSQVIGI